MGDTPLSETYIYLGDVLNELHATGLKADYSQAGQVDSTLDMAGITLNMLALDDPTWLKVLNASAHTVGWGDTDVKR